METHQTGLLRCAFIGLFVVLILLFCRACCFVTVRYTYTSWALSDWLINYQGGFVRRGIVGEILYQCYQWQPYPVRDAILLICLMGFGLLVLLLVHVFRKEGWSPVLFSAPFLFAAFYMPPGGLFWNRKDSWLLLMTFGIFCLYRRWLRRKDVMSLCALQLLSVVLVLAHEAAFFFTVPLLFWSFYSFVRAKRAFSMVMSAGAACLMLLPALLAMGAVCICKGDQARAIAIWHSWDPLFERYPLDCDPAANLGISLDALTWETVETFKTHFTVNYLRFFFGPVPGLPFTLLSFAGMYYLVTRLNTVDLKWNVLRGVDRVRLSNFLLLQGFFLLPLFTVLSCDFGRIIIYWLFSSFFAYHLLKADACLFPAAVSRVSEYLQRQIDRVKCLSNPWVYAFVLLFLPVFLDGGARLLRSFPLLLISKVIIAHV